MADNTASSSPANGVKVNGHRVNGKKQIILNAFMLNSSTFHSPRMWRHPRNKTEDFTKLSYWTNLAQMLDKANFHALFLADLLGAPDVYKGPKNFIPALKSASQFPIHDPLPLIPAMAAVTKNLVFGATASITYEKPFALARRMSTLDHLSEGRVAWNVVTSYMDSAARNHGLEEQIPHDERYAMAHEYMDVMYKLFEGSFRDDAVVRDRKEGTYISSDGVLPINHKGKYFEVPGPHICEPSPQRTPLLFNAGVSEVGLRFGAKHGEVLFVAGQTPEILRKTVDKIEGIAKEQGRDRGHFKIIIGIAIVVAPTDEEAEAKRQEYLQYIDHEGALALFSAWTGVDVSRYADDEDLRLKGTPMVQAIVKQWADTVPGTENLPWTKQRVVEYTSITGPGVMFVGSPTTVADKLEWWVDEAGIDGFNISCVENPGSYEDIIELLLPELRRRGVLRSEVEKEGATVREVFLGSSRLPEDHPGSQYKWRAGEARPKYQEAEELAAKEGESQHE